MKYSCVAALILLFTLFLTSCDDGSAGSDSDGDQNPDEIVCTQDSDCPSGKFCDIESGNCITPSSSGKCLNDSDCLETEYCDTDTGDCVTITPVDGDAEIEDDATTDGDDIQTDGDSDFDIRCDDRLPCTEDSYNGTDCVYTLLPGFCLINDACISDSVTRPGNVCMACRSAVSDNAWSPVDNGASCNDNSVCTSPDACEDGQCVGTALNCSDDIDCTDDGCEEPGGCQNVPNDALCAQHEYCDPIIGCNPNGCNPDDIRCVGTERQRCDNFGEWQVLEECEGDTPVCNVAGCRECTPGNAHCEGRWEFVCNDDGEWLATYCLGPELACDGNACSPCTNGQIWCGPNEEDDWAIYECTNGSWTMLEDCDGATPMCGDLNDGNGIVCLECPPNMSRCDGLSHQICDENGVWQVDPCPTDRPYCENGSCVTCLENSRRCGDPGDGEQRNDVYTCLVDDDFYAWQLDGPCPPEAPNCNNGVCESCTPGDSRCREDQQGTEVCNDDGLWVPGEDCIGGNYCDPLTGECTDGWSLHFDGDSKMEIPDNNEYDPNAEFTVEAWIFPTELSGNCDTSGNTILEKWAAWPVGSYLLAVCSDFYGRTNVARFFAIVEPDKQDYFHSSNDAINVGEWNHVAVVWADDSMEMFINGVRESTRPNYIGWRTPNTYQQNVLAIGRLDDRIGWGFNGYIDEVRISKIRRYSGETYTPEMRFTPDAFTTGLWHMDDFLDDTVCEDSSGHHDGNNTYGATFDELGVGETP